MLGCLWQIVSRRLPTFYGGHFEDGAEDESPSICRVEFAGACGISWDGANADGSDADG